jgi:hypothetical protein
MRRQILYLAASPIKVTHDRHTSAPALSPGGRALLVRTSAWVHTSATVQQALQTAVFTRLLTRYRSTSRKTSTRVNGSTYCSTVEDEVMGDLSAIFASVKVALQHPRRSTTNSSYTRTRRRLMYVQSFVRASATLTRRLENKAHDAEHRRRDVAPPRAPRSTSYGDQLYPTQLSL